MTCTCTGRLPPWVITLLESTAVSGTSSVAFGRSVISFSDGASISSGTKTASLAVSGLSRRLRTRTLPNGSEA